MSDHQSTDLSSAEGQLIMLLERTIRQRDAAIAARDLGAQRIAALEDTLFNPYPKETEDGRQCVICRAWGPREQEHELNPKCRVGIVFAVAGLAARDAKTCPKQDCVNKAGHKGWHSFVLLSESTRCQSKHKPPQGPRVKCERPKEHAGQHSAHDEMFTWGPSASAPPAPHLPPAESYPIEIEITEVRQGEPRPGEQEADG